MSRKRTTSECQAHAPGPCPPFCMSNGLPRRVQTDGARIAAECWTCAARQEGEYGFGGPSDMPIASLDCRAAGHDVREKGE